MYSLLTPYPRHMYSLFTPYLHQGCDTHTHKGSKTPKPCKSYCNGVNSINGVYVWDFVCGCTGVTFRSNLCCWGVKCMCHATRLRLPVSTLPNVSFHFSNKQGILFPPMTSRRWRRNFRVLKSWACDLEFPKIVSRSWGRNLRVASPCHHLRCSYIPR